LFIKN